MTLPLLLPGRLARVTFLFDKKVTIVVLNNLVHVDLSDGIYHTSATLQLMLSLLCIISKMAPERMTRQDEISWTFDFSLFLHLQHGS